MRIIDFSDGFSNASAPSSTTTSAASVASYASEAAFVTAKGSAAATGDMFLDTTANSIKFYEDSAWKTAVTLDATQTLTNKTLTAPTISTPTVTTPITVAESATPSTPSSGYAAIYPKSNGKWYSKNDSGSEALLGSGSGSGAKNYLQRDDAVFGQQNGDFEVGADEDTLGSTVGSNVVGWQLFNTTLTGVIPTGSISNGASSITLAKLDSNVITLLEGSLSLVIGTSGGTAISAGHGFISNSFALDACDSASVMQIAFDYYPYIATGTDFSGTSSNTFAVYIYDVFNSAWIQPAGVYGMNTKGRIGKCYATFQTGSGGGIYRLAIVCINATTSAAKTIAFDNFFVGPQARLYGAPIGDWTSFTPTGSWSSNTSYSGYYRRVGDEMEVQVLVQTTGAPTSATLTVNLPSGHTINTSKLAGGADTNNKNLGTVSILDSGTAQYWGTVAYSSTSAVQAIVLLASGTYAQTNSQEVSQSTPMTFANGDAVFFDFKVPIQGWSSPVVFSHDTDTRIVAALYESNTARSISNSAANTGEFLCEDKIIDTHNFVSSSTAIATIPVSGIYEVSASVKMASGGGWATGEVLQLRLYKNGNLDRHLGEYYSYSSHSENVSTNGSTLIECIAGDTLEVRVYQTSGASLNTGGNENENWVSYKRLSGPSVIAASETVACCYTTASGTFNDTSVNIVTYGTKLKDTHGMMSGSVVTIPVSGLYSISAAFGVNFNCTASSGGSPSNDYIHLYKDGAGFLTAAVMEDGDGDNVVQSYTINIQAVPLLAGQTLQVRSQRANTTGSVHSASSMSWFSVVRVGNY